MSKSNSKRSYHGYGPDGYKPSPRHGKDTNLDWAKRADRPDRNVLPRHYAK